MRLLLFGSIPFETEDVPPADMAALRIHAALQNKSLQSLIEDTLRSCGVSFTPDGLPAKNFVLNCSNFSQFAKGRITH